MLHNNYNQISKLGKCAFYLFFIYIMGMTGLYFHMETRITVLQSIQKSSLELFQSYSTLNGRQQSEINSLNDKIVELKEQVEDMSGSLDEKLTELYHLLLSNKAEAAELTAPEDMVPTNYVDKIPNG